MKWKSSQISLSLDHMKEKCKDKESRDDDRHCTKPWRQHQWISEALFLFNFFFCFAGTLSPVKGFFIGIPVVNRWFLHNFSLFWKPAKEFPETYVVTSERSSRRLARRLFPLFRRAIERFFPRIFPPAAAGIRKLYYFICCWQGNPYPQGYVPRRQEKIRKRTCAGPHYVHHLPRTVRNRENDVNNLKTDGTKEEMQKNESLTRTWFQRMRS